MQQITIAGHLGKDPENRFTADGKKVITLVIATNSRKGGKDETTWWRCTIWGDRFDKMLPYLKKGSAVIITGEMHKPSIYTDKNGSPQVSMDLTVDTIRFSPFGKPAENNQERAAAPAQAFTQPAEITQGRGSPANLVHEDDDDALPF